MLRRGDRHPYAKVLKRKIPMGHFQAKVPKLNIQSDKFPAGIPKRKLPAKGPKRRLPNKCSKQTQQSLMTAPKLGIGPSGTSRPVFGMPVLAAKSVFQNPERQMTISDQIEEVCEICPNLTKSN